MSGPNYSRVWTIYEMLSPKPKDLLDTNRFFVREGEIYVWDEKQKKRKKRYAFLFNDIMLLTKKEGSKRYWLRVFITLRSPFVNVEDISSGMSSGFKLLCRTRTFIFFTATPELNKQWMAETHDSAKGNHDKRAATENGSSANGTTSPGGGAKRTTSSAAFHAGADEPRNRGGRQVFSYDSSIANDSISAQVSFDSGMKLDTLRPIEDDDQVVPVLSPPPPRGRATSKGKQGSTNLIVSPAGTGSASVVATSPSPGSLLDDFIDFESESKQHEKAYRAQQERQAPQDVGANPFSVAAIPSAASPVSAPVVAATANPMMSAMFSTSPQQPYMASPSQAQLLQQQQMYQMQLQQQQQMQMQMQMQQMSLQSQPTSFNPFAGIGGPVAAPPAQSNPAMSPFFGGGSTLSSPMAPPAVTSSYSTSTSSSAQKDPFAGLWEASKSAKPVTATATATPAPAGSGKVDFPF